MYTIHNKLTEESYNRAKLDFHDYLVKMYDYIECIQACRIGGHVYGINLKDAKKIWKEIYE